ncbi:MAG: hypothetical protein EXQ85_05770 [Alphaproteobacteria bacterium]|nr:hypothetical protein [Alphaproteobacteria bacterium]
MRDQFNYHQLVDAALRSVVREALRQVQREGLRGNHHMYISFRTQHPGIVVAEYLRNKYPKEMTVVIQHRFWELDVRDDSFDLTLSFHKVPERLTVPFAAMTGFADPSVQFGLQFQGGERGQDEETPKATLLLGTRAEVKAPAAVATTPAADDGPATGRPAAVATEKVVTLDQFRKK